MTAEPPPTARLVRSGSSYAGAVGLQLIVQAISLPIITRLLEPAEFGVMATTLVIANLLAVVVDLGLARAVTRAYYRAGGDEAAALLLGALVIVVVTSGIALAVEPLWGGWLGSGAQNAVRAAVGLGAAMAARNVVLGLLRTRQESRSYVVVMLLGTAGAQLLGLAVAVVRPAPAGYLMGLACGSVAGALVGVALLRPSPAARSRRSMWAWAMTFALPLVPGELAAVAIWFSDRIVIERLLGLDAVGRYQIAYTLGSIVLMMAMAVSAAWAPVVYSAATGETARIADDTQRLLLRLAAHAVVAVAVGGPVVLVLLIPGDYRPGGLFWVTAIVALSALPLVMQQAANHLLANEGRSTVLGAVGVAAAVLNVVANLVLVPVWGLTGSAIATLGTYVVYAAVLRVAARRATGARLQFEGIAWAAAGLGACVGSAIPAGGWWSALRIAGVLVVAAAFFRAVPSTLSAGPAAAEAADLP